jgi:membrane protease YdiL (CAAX protease family)
VYEQAADGEPSPLAEPVSEAVGRDSLREADGRESLTVPGIVETPTPSNLGQRATALLEVMLCSGYPTQLMLVVIMTQLGMRIRTPTGGLTPSFVFVLSLVDAVLVVSLIFFFIKARGESIRHVLLGDRKVVREGLLGIMLVPVVFLAVVILLGVLLTLVPRLHNVPRNPLEAMVQTPRDAVIFSVVVMIAGGVREEVQRGFIVHRFDQYLGGAAFGVAAYSVAFGLGHLEQGWDAALATGLLGAIWGCVYLVRRSIVAPMVSHAGFNLLQLIKFVTLR